MSVPTDPVQAIFALVVMGVAILLMVKAAALLFFLYLSTVGGIYLHGRRVWGTLALCLGAMILGGLGWLTFQGLMALAGWLL